jgi:ribose transport system permease protein
MNPRTETAVDENAEQATPPSAGPAGQRRGIGPWLRRNLSFRNISALYVFVVLFAIFSIWVPSTFLTWEVWKSLFDAEAVTAIVAIALIIPLAAGAFDLAIGSEVGFGAIVVAWLLSKHGVPLVPALALTLVAGGLVGLASGLLIVKVRVDSFIATLGISSILLALIAWISNSTQILGLSTGFQDIAGTEVLGLTLPVFLMLGIGIVVWYVLECTPVGRRVYATGGNAEAAKLAGVRTGAIVVGCLVACGVIAAFGGVLVSSRLATGDPTVGPAYLLPAFSAAFLGSTQFRGGRFNVWGTIVAVYVLATGIKGLQLAGAPTWIPDLFNGVALIFAVGLARFERVPGSGWLRRLLGLGRRAPESA